MSMQPELLRANIVRFNSKGKPIACSEGDNPVVIEMPFGIPGDVFLVQIGKKRRGKAKAIKAQLEMGSKDRAVPRCSHIETCGGCQWQELEYSLQLELKQKKIDELFRPFLSDTTTSYPIVPCVYTKNLKSLPQEPELG